MNRRNFITTATASLFSFFILPGADRIWKPTYHSMWWKTEGLENHFEVFRYYALFHDCVDPKTRMSDGAVYRPCARSTIEIGQGEHALCLKWKVNGTDTPHSCLCGFVDENGLAGPAPDRIVGILAEELTRYSMSIVD